MVVSTDVFGRAVIDGSLLSFVEDESFVRETAGTEGLAKFVARDVVGVSRNFDVGADGNSRNDRHVRKITKEDVKPFGVVAEVSDELIDQCLRKELLQKFEGMGHSDNAHNHVGSMGKTNHEVQGKSSAQE